VDDEEIVKIHVHTSDPGSVLSEAIRYGALLTVKIENMRVQHSELTTQQVVKKIVPGKYSFVSVANGDGICAAFRDLGVDELVMGGQTMNPSTEQMLEAIGRTDGEYVFVLPNNSNIILVAQQAAQLLEGERCVRVLPTKSVPQGVSALYAFDPEASLEDNTAAMTEAMGGVCTLSMTKAVRDADIDGLHIRQGQVLGMINGKVEVVSNTLCSALEQLLDPLLHASCVTVFCGEDLDDDEASEITALLRGALQEDTDLTVMEGGQPVYSLIIGGE
jgi:dihydroxyacetone kinase-like predicted kinase